MAGTFRVIPLAAILAFIGVILPLVYTVRLLQELLFTTERRPLALADLSLREGALMSGLCAAIVCLGVYPAPDQPRRASNTCYWERWQRPSSHSA